MKHTQLLSYNAPVAGRFVRTILATAYLGLLGACATSARSFDDGTSVQVETGYPGCPSCTKVRTFTSKTVASQMYAVRNADDETTGQHLSATVVLGISNRKISADDGTMAGLQAADYLQQVNEPEARLFDGEVATDANHPYRFVLRMHLNANVSDFVVELVEGERFTYLPAMRLEGEDNRRSCFASGCVWDADYVISARVMEEHIEKGTPLSIYIGHHLRHKVPSKDGMNMAVEKVNRGTYLNVSTAQLRNFLGTVRAQLKL